MTMRQSPETVPAKTIVTRMKKPGAWFGADYNMNIYRGCTHGCIYCDSRSVCYRNPEFDRIKVKGNALETLRNDLRRKVRRGVIATGAMSDPYNPLERELELTRHSLELISAYSFGVAIATKGALITRDIDVMNEVREHSPVLVKMTITTADDALSKKIEPGAPSSSERFQAIAELSKAGIFVGVLLMPVLPFLTDTEENVHGILKGAYEAGAKFVYPAFGMTLREGNREYYYKHLDRHFPGLKGRYEKTFGTAYQCSSPRSEALFRLFSEECRRLGLLYSMKSIIFSSRAGYDAQLSLF